MGRQSVRAPRRRLPPRPRRSGARKRTAPGSLPTEHLIGDTPPGQAVRGDPVDREDDRSLGVGGADSEVVDGEAPLGQLDAEPTELHTFSADEALTVSPSSG